MSKHCWPTICLFPPIDTIRPEKQINIRSRRNKTGSNSQGNSVSTNSNAKMATTATMISSSSSSSSSSVPSSSSSSSSSSGKRGGGVPFHHRPSCPAPARAHTAVAGVGQKLLPDNNATAALTPGGLGSVDGVQDRVNRSVFIMPQPTNEKKHTHSKTLLLLLPIPIPPSLLLLLGFLFGQLKENLSRLYTTALERNQNERVFCFFSFNAESKLQPEMDCG